VPGAAIEMVPFSVALCRTRAAVVAHAQAGSYAITTKASEKDFVSLSIIA